MRAYALLRVKAIARLERSTMRARRCILIAIFAYTGARVTTRNNKRDCFPTLTRVLDEIQLTLTQLRGSISQICFLWKRKRIYKD